MTRRSPTWSRAPRRCAFAVLLAAVTAAAGCYETRPLHLVVAPFNTRRDCVQTIARVFAQAGFVARSGVSGPNFYYTPNMTSANGYDGSLHWGIGVWIDPQARPEGGRCSYELEALSPDPDCGILCPLSSQRGEEADQYVRELLQRLRDAFRDPAPSD